MTYILLSHYGAAGKMFTHYFDCDRKLLSTCVADYLNAHTKADETQISEFKKLYPEYFI